MASSMFLGQILDAWEIKSNLAALSAQMAVMMEEVNKRGKGSAKGEKQVSFQENKEALNYKGLPSLPSIL
jgi:hypothetical protein